MKGRSFYLLGGVLAVLNKTCIGHSNYCKSLNIYYCDFRVTLFTKQLKVAILQDLIFQSIANVVLDLV